MNIEELALKHFPYQTPNPGQLEAIIEIATHIVHGNKHIILDSPVGTGKSVIAYTVHKILEEHLKYKSTILTATKGLQDQYIKDFNTIVNLKGKSNYMCIKNCGPYGSAGCRKAVHSQNCSADKCPYIIQRKAWSACPGLRLTNNAFFLKAPTSIKSVPEFRSDLVVIDECHEIDDAIIDNSAFKIDAEGIKLLSEFDLNLVTLIVKVTQTIGKGVGIGKPFLVNEEIINTFGEIVGRCENIIDREQDNQHFPLPVKEVLQELISSANLLIRTPNVTWIVTHFDKSDITFKPVYASDVADYVMFRHADYFIHMSATICGAKVYADSLGIKEFKYVKVAHPIPVSQREINIIDGFYLSKSFSNYEKYYKLVNSILNHHKNERGIIHSVSFTLAKQIHDNLSPDNKKRALVSGDYKEIIEFMRMTPEGIIISPSIEKGYDFKDDLSRFQIIAKIPYGFLGDPHVKYNSEISKDWYARKAILRLVQASGRSIRGVNDWANTYIIDSNAFRLLQNKHLVPDWFLESVKK